MRTAHKAQDIPAIDAAMTELQNAAAKLYQAQQQAGPGPDMNGGCNSNCNTGSQQSGKDDIQDADFEEVK